MGILTKGVTGCAFPSTSTIVAQDRQTHARNML